MSVDEVAVIDPQAPQPSPSVAHFTELELERASGAPMNAFRALVSELMQLNLDTSPTSKLQRGIAAVADRPAGSPEKSGIQADMAMSEAGRLIWRRQLAAMALNEAGARLGEDPEYVHDMRVATRRARSAARIFGEYFEQRPMKPLLRGLKKTADRLGAVRDLDVALGKLAASGLAAGQEPLAREWTSERAKAESDLVSWLDSDGYRRFLAALGRLAVTPNLGARDFTAPDDAIRPHQVRHTFPEAIVERYAIVRAYENVIDDPDLPNATLHMLRIDCKRLRYVLEPVTDLLGSDGADLVKTLKKLQDVLGELNDAEVARGRLIALAARGLGGPNLAEYLEAQEAEIERWVAAVPERWSEVVSQGYRTRLYKAVAQI
jgi:CHAD domain-containing protein